MRKDISFGSDNHSGVHPSILQAIIDCNIGHEHSYGLDSKSLELQHVCKEIFGPNCEAFPVFNGTAANVLCLTQLIRSFESVICANTAHLNESECGAPEKHLGCKLIDIASDDGKLTPELISPYLIRRGDQHFSQPQVISITQPTEYGTVYSLQELAALRDFAQHNQLRIHIDGSRLIYAAAQLQCSFQDLVEASGADAISFGGTKNGLLYGELCLFFSPVSEFRFYRKQLMQLPSKQRFISAQFLALLKAGLWREISTHGISLANSLAAGLRNYSEIQITQAVQSNAVFAKFPKQWIKTLRQKHFFYIWDEKTFEARLLISFDHSKEDVESFLQTVERCSKGNL